MCILLIKDRNHSFNLTDTYTYIMLIMHTIKVTKHVVILLMLIRLEHITHIRTYHLIKSEQNLTEYNRTEQNLSEYNRT